MYGYATDETEEMMPLTVVLSHNLNKKMAELRRDGTLPWLRPDSKSQVRLITMRDTIQVSTTHQHCFSVGSREVSVAPSNTELTILRT